ncbi:MAG: dihydroorotate dehydrogenase, partial [Planctomycetota bacterium]
CRAVRGATGLPVFAKLTPNVTDVVAIGQAAEAGGADAVTAINTLLGLAVRWRSRTAALGRGAGGLSGPAIKPVALRIVAQLARALTIPVIGVGGIAGVDDVLEFIVAGASAVQIGTAIFADPLLLPRVIEALPQRLLEAGLDSIERLRGSLELA